MFIAERQGRLAEPEQKAGEAERGGGVLEGYGAEEGWRQDRHPEEAVPRSLAGAGGEHPEDSGAGHRRIS